MTQDEYNAAFNDGIRHVTVLLRRAAERVERPTRGTFQKPDQTTIEAIAHVGQPFFASRLRELATELETLCIT